MLTIVEGGVSDGAGDKVLVRKSLDSWVSLSSTAGLTYCGVGARVRGDLSYNYGGERTQKLQAMNYIRLSGYRRMLCDAMQELKTGKMTRSKCFRSRIQNNAICFQPLDAGMRP